MVAVMMAEVVVGLTHRTYYGPEAVLALYVMTHFINTQEASMLPPLLQQKGDAMRRKSDPALFGKPTGLSASRGTMGLVDSQTVWDQFSKWHFPRCKLRPSDFKT